MATATQVRFMFMGYPDGFWLLAGTAVAMLFPFAVFAYFRFRFLNRGLHSRSYPVIGSRENLRESRIIFLSWLVAIFCIVAVCAIDNAFVTLSSTIYIAIAV
ncbi:MAG: hypothetical protein ABSG16_02255 [Candidatus Acidiferrum sp.]